jgi:lysophospholipase L1-like esterase
MKRPIVIAGFGASTMRGWRPGLANHETFRALFERDLVNLGIPAVFTDAAQPGNTVLGGQQRFERDVLLPRPDAVVIDFGINDSSLRSPDSHRTRVGLETYREVHEYWLDVLAHTGIPVLILTPQKLSLADAGAHNRRLLSYVEILRTLAKDHKVPLVDVYAALDQREAETGNLTEYFLDGMHLNARGNRFVADLLLDFEKKAGFFAGISARLAAP